MINRLSNPLNRNRSASKISKVKSPSENMCGANTLGYIISLERGNVIDMNYLRNRIGNGILKT